MLLRLREWRQHFQLTQADLASRSGLKRETISAIETGRQDATVTQLEDLATALALHVSDLLDERPCPQCPYRQQPPPAGPPEDTCRFTLHTRGEPPRRLDFAATRGHMQQVLGRAQRARAHSLALLTRLGRSAGLLWLLGAWT